MQLLSIKKLLSVFFIISLLSSWSAYAQRVVTIAYHEQFPEIFTGDNGAVQGRMATSLERTMKQAGYDVEFRSLPLKRIYYSLIRGKVDAWYGTATVPHLQGETRNSKSLTTLELRVYYVGNKKELTSNEADFTGKKVISLMGESYGTLGEYITDESNNVDLLQVKTYEQGVKALIAGRKDYLIAYKENIEGLTHVSGVSTLRYSTIGTVDFALICSKEVEDSKEFLMKFDKAWQQTGAH